MSGPIDPIRRPGRTQRVDGVRAHDPDESPQDRAEREFTANLPAVIEPAEPEPNPRRRRAPPLQSGGPATAPFAAQLLGQPGIKRGLRGGPETLDAARSTYLGTEYSGPNDRRPAPGRITKTEI